MVGHAALFASPADVKRATVRLLVAGDHAVQEWVTRGTQAASGKVVGFQAASVYRFGGDGRIRRDATYFDLLTPAVQTGKKDGEARAVPELPAAPVVVVAGEASRDGAAVEAIRKLYAALGGGHAEAVEALLAEDVTEVSLLSVKDAVGRAAVRRELAELWAGGGDGGAAPGVEITGAWGDASVGAAEMVLGRDGRRVHALHVVDMAGGRIARSVIYASRGELEAE